MGSASNMSFLGGLTGIIVGEAVNYMVSRFFEMPSDQMRIGTDLVLYGVYSLGLSIEPLDQDKTNKWLD